MIYLLLFFNILLLVSGQMLWKVGMGKIGSNWSAGMIVELIQSPFIIGGGLIYVVATVIWLYILTKMPFSIAYPLQSLAYVIGMYLGYAIFKEVVTPVQWFGAGFIIFGVYLIAR